MPLRLRSLRGLFIPLSGVAAILIVGIIIIVRVRMNDRASPPLTANSNIPPIKLVSANHITVWWDQLDPLARLRARTATETSNIHPTDYTGPTSCQHCHPHQHEQWSEHPHKGMNALASAATIRGDFSGKSSIEYQGGRGSFERSTTGNYLMKLERGTIRRTYQINQTIGVRFQQYYVGKQIEGPEPKGHHFYEKDHVLPFGYLLERKEWAPVVHIGPELPDEARPDVFNPPDHGLHYAEYAASCNYCHTTFPMGDLLARRPHQMGEHAPLPLHWSMKGYLEGSHPAESQVMAKMIASGSSAKNPMADWDATRYAVTLGISCEACHLGAKAHAESGGKVLPDFFPSSPHLSVESKVAPETGRTHDNINWACGRCHTGGRPTFAGGMSTWNSVEFADAAKGSCYSQLRCIDCHPPHQALGRKWSQPPDRDDQVCLKCHEGFRAADRRAAHTHHSPGSEGDRCLNCHMPRINEGLQDVVRTHMIYSPTRPDMLQANHPNACNLCHTDRPIDWTLTHLKSWYSRSFDEREIAKNYMNRSEPVGLGWLSSSEASVRLVGADAILRTSKNEMIPRIIDALDDPYLLNRQFAAKGLEAKLGIKLGDFGYRFYQQRSERASPLKSIRSKIVTVPKGN